MKPRVAVLVAGLAYVCLGLWITHNFATWTDEEYTLATTGHGALYAFHRAIDYELQAPLYFVVLALWREIDPSVWFARLFSILCATGFFFALVSIGRRVDERVDPLPFAALVALNPFVLQAAFEIRLYSLALLLSAVCWIVFDIGFVRGSDWRARAAFVFLSITGIYVQYFLAFMIAGFGADLAVRRPRALRSFLVCAVIVAFAALPLIVAARSQVGGYSTAGPPLSTLLRTHAFHPWLDFVVPNYETWVDRGWIRLTYYAVIIVCAALYLVNRPRLDRKTVASLAAAAAIELVYLALVVLLREKLDYRYFVALFVPVVVAAYALFLNAQRDKQPLAALAFLPTLLAIVVIIEQYRFFAQSGDWKRVAMYLEKNGRKGDVVAIYPADAIPAFIRQYTGSLPYVPFPHAYSHNQYSVEALTLTSTAQAVTVLSHLHSYRRIWLIDAEHCSHQIPSFGCNYIPALAQQPGFVGRTQFFDSSVYEFDDRLSSGDAKADPH